VATASRKDSSAGALGHGQADLRFLHVRLELKSQPVELSGAGGDGCFEMPARLGQIVPAGEQPSQIRVRRSEVGLHANGRAEGVFGAGGIPHFRESAAQVVAGFGPVATLRPGNLGPNAIRGPGLWNVDFSLAKNFPIREQVRLQLRADMFNALNHTNLSNPSTSTESATFGRITSTRGSRGIQLNARISF